MMKMMIKLCACFLIVILLPLAAACQGASEDDKMTPAEKEQTASLDVTKTSVEGKESPESQAPEIQGLAVMSNEEIMKIISAVPHEIMDYSISRELFEKDGLIHDWNLAIDLKEKSYSMLFIVSLPLERAAFEEKGLELLKDGKWKTDSVSSSLSGMARGKMVDMFLKDADLPDGTKGVWVKINEREAQLPAFMSLDGVFPESLMSVGKASDTLLRAMEYNEDTKTVSSDFFGVSYYARGSFEEVAKDLSIKLQGVKDFKEVRLKSGDGVRITGICGDMKLKVAIDAYTGDGTQFDGSDQYHSEVDFSLTYLE